MAQTMNKKAIADLFRLEDARSLCESFGNNMPIDDGSDENFEPVQMDGMFDVVTNDAPTSGEVFGSFGDDTATEEGRAAITEAFVSELEKSPSETLEISDIPSLATVIQAQNGFKGDIAGFLQNEIISANNMLGAMNVSEQNPDGAVADDIAPAASAEPEMGLGDGIVPPMTEVPPSAPAPEPSLDTNLDDMSGLGDGLDDLGLDSEPAPVDELGGFDSVEGLDEPAPEASDDTEDLGDLDLGEDTLKDAVDDGLDDMDFSGLDDLDDSEVASDESEPAEESEPADEDEPKEEPASEEGLLESADEAPADEAPAEDAAPAEPAAAPASEKIEIKVTPGENEITADLECTEAKLEAARSAYLGKKLDEDIRAIVESCCAERKAKIEREQALNDIVESARQEKVKNTKAQLESIVGDYAAKVNAKDHDMKVMAQLESIANDFRKASAASKKDAKTDAQLESIVSDFAKSVRSAKAAKKTEAKLESILKSFDKQESCDAKLESILNEFEEKKPTLESQLDAIAEETKQKLG